MEDIKSMISDQWEIVRDIHTALKKTSPAAADKTAQVRDLSQALESAVSTWRMLKDISPR